MGIKIAIIILEFILPIMYTVDATKTKDKVDRIIDILLAADWGVLAILNLINLIK